MAKDILGLVDWKVIEVPKKVKKTARVEFRVSPELFVLLRGLAWYKDCSVSSLVLSALRFYLSASCDVPDYSEEELDAAFGQRY